MPEQTAQQSTTTTVLDAVRELHELGQIAARETVAHRTGLKLSIVDDRLRALTDDGDLVRVARGVYEPAVRYPQPRVISKTVLHNGMVKYDIGDEVLTLTPTEARRLAELSMGAAAAAVAIQSAQGHLMLASQLADQVNRQQAQIEAMRNTIRQLAFPEVPQLELAAKSKGD